MNSYYPSEIYKYHQQRISYQSLVLSIIVIIFESSKITSSI